MMYACCIGSRIIVKRKEVETVMMNLKSVKTMQERPIKSTKTITDFYSAKEIEEKYQIALFEKLIEHTKSWGLAWLKTVNWN